MNIRARYKKFGLETGRNKRTNLCDIQNEHKVALLSVSVTELPPLVIKISIY
jgi:hypothetical protein